MQYTSNNNIKMNTEKKISIADKAIQKKYDDFTSTVGKNKIMWWVFVRDGIGGYMDYDEMMQQLKEEKFDDKELGEIYVLSKRFNDKYETKSLFIKAIKRYITMFEVYGLSPQEVDQAEWDAIADGVCTYCGGGIRRKDMARKRNGDLSDKCKRCTDKYLTTFYNKAFGANIIQLAADSDYDNNNAGGVRELVISQMEDAELTEGDAEQTVLVISCNRK